MPVPAPQLGEYKYVEETKEKLNWADLVTVDLGLYDTPEGKKQLSETLITALRDKGFFYVKNFGISQDQVNKQFAIGKEFYELPQEEKEKYTPEGLDEGKFNGFIPPGRRIIDVKSGLRDNVAAYNIPKFDGFFDQNHPEVVAQNITEIEEFSKVLHSKVLIPLLTLLAIALELPEDHFANLHKYEEKSEDHLRYMKYGKRTAEEYKKIEEAEIEHFVGGHTDLGTFTLLFRQPVAGLQIRYHSTNEWKWVQPQDATLTVNAADALQFLTGGYVKSTVHRVTLPPKDQRHVDRLGLLYFSRPNNTVKLNTASASPVLQREGFAQNDFEKSGNEVPTMHDWTFAKQKWQRTKGAPTKEHATATILPGFQEKVYA